MESTKRVLFSQIEDQSILPQDEIPCPDSVPQVSEKVTARFRNCVMVKLQKQCAKSLAGSWTDPENVVVEELRNCGLSNYLFLAHLRDDVPVRVDEPRKVFIRVYGEVLRRSVNSIVLDSISFALLAEKRIGPGLHGVFPGGRIEEFVESRALMASELSKPKVTEAVARQMARIHRLNMPFCKLPIFLFKLMDKMLAQLNGLDEPPRRPRPNLSTESLHALQVEYDTDTSQNGFYTPPGFAAVQEMAIRLRLREEYDWLKNKLQECSDSVLPVVFCHNDMQENNILVLNHPEKDDDMYELLPIDFEYAGYNYRGFDVGNHFNEWCYDYTHPCPPYYIYDYDKYPTRDEQIRFWLAYLSAYEADRRNSLGVMENASNHVLASETNGTGDLLVTDFDQLLTESWYGSLYSHIFWCTWSLVQSQLSSIQFQFSDYAEARMDAYYKLKSMMPKGVATNTMAQ